MNVQTVMTAIQLAKAGVGLVKDLTDMLSDADAATLQESLLDLRAETDVIHARVQAKLRG